MKVVRNLIFGLFSMLLMGAGHFAFATGVDAGVAATKPLNECKGVKLNTNLPFLGNCIGVSSDGRVNQLNAFPIMIKGLMKIIISIVLVMSFLMIVAGGVMMTTAGYESGNFAKGKGMITSVAKALAMLGASGVILKLINPNFFN
ncbi:hypothetical protein HXK74_03610 [Candidatus Gracilibacteria bacterium]|nr:hypothetical protein [Candidatus Gracilibacteria bacterium]